MIRGPSESMKRPSRLSFSELDMLCMGLGHICIHCGNPLPEGESAPRICPTVSAETCHRLARKMHQRGES